MGNELIDLVTKRYDERIKYLVMLTQAHALMWSVTILVMLEEDAAMLAFMFS